jgi:hypothetical protein
MIAMLRRALLVASLLMISACAKEAAPVTKDQAPAPPPKGTLNLGEPIPASVATTPLADIAKDPGAFKGKTVTTTGTVSAVCQAMGCWMEIKDEASQAHIKMAGHSFFVPKTAAGHHARVRASVVSGGDENAECNEEAAKQMGHAVAKVQLEATGVELD